MLSAATGPMVMGYAGTAAAHDSATTVGAASDSPGAVSGNVAQLPADVPIQVCGLAGGALSADVTAHDNDCIDDGTHAVAKGAASDSPGLVSGNVLQLPVDAPIQACGDSVALLGFGTGAKDNHCVNGGPEMAPPVMAPPPMSPPPVPCPPPPNPCPPSAHTWGPMDQDGSAQTAYDADDEDGAPAA